MHLESLPNLNHFDEVVLPEWKPGIGNCSLQKEEIKELFS